MTLANWCEINGWTITTRLYGEPAQYHVARKGGRIRTSKDINYLVRVCEQS